jgi:peptidoglycan pentaglycine glycine transferase (the first glycine)
MSQLGGEDWELFLTGFPNAHILQTRAWGDFKAAFGWTVERVVQRASGAQVLFKSLPIGFSIAYIPKGPVGENWHELWLEIEEICLRKRAVLLKVEPDGWEEEEKYIAWKLAGFRSGGVSVQPRRTITISLEGDETLWLQRMKQKTRYNIRLAQKKDVVVESSSDIETFHRLMTMTGARDGFGVHSQEYYRKVYQLFHPCGAAELLLAWHAGRVLAGLMVFARGKRAWYFYGASNDEERARMPAYLLQWEAMRWAAAHGCEEYDLWGVPDEDEVALEAGFEKRQDGLWGVYRFKRGFGGKVRRHIQTYEKVFNPVIYAIYRGWARSRGEA